MPGSIPKDNYIDINTVSQNIDNCVIEFFNQYDIDIYNPQNIKTISHNMLSLCMRYIYERLFKPDKTLCNNQKSYIDYNNIDLLQVLANKFIDICLMFNKSLGLMSFGFMCGIDYSTLMRWQNEKELNPQRCEILKSVQEGHKMCHIGLLNDTPVGALAVANNDYETGLEWGKNQQVIATQNVYYLPSERSERLKLDAPGDNNNSV
jgi:hypothetical protein